MSLYFIRAQDSLCAVVHLIDVATPPQSRVCVCVLSLVIEVSGHNQGAIKRA